MVAEPDPNGCHIVEELCLVPTADCYSSDSSDRRMILRLAMLPGVIYPILCPSQSIRDAWIASISKHVALNVRVFNAPSSDVIIRFELRKLRWSL